MKINKTHSLLLFLGATFFASCNMDTAETTSVEKPRGIHVEYMDTLVSPADDFFNYVNGKWVAEAEIPGDKGRWGRFDELGQNTLNNTLDVLKKAVENNTYKEGSDQFKAVTFYKTAMNTEKLNADGVNPILPYLAKIADAKTMADLVHTSAEMEKLGFGGIWNFGVSPDAKKSSIYAANLNPGSLGLPGREYYINDDDESKETRTKYAAHITRMMGFLGVKEASAKAKGEAILAFESKLAEPMLTKEERRNPTLTYNKMSIADLEKLVADVNWKDYFQTLGAGTIDSLIVSQPKYIIAAAKLLQSENLDLVKDYYVWTYFDRFATKLSEEIELANFDFFAKELRGTKEQTPRDERVLRNVNRSIGEAVGKVYVDEYFPPEAKAKAEELVDNVLAAFSVRIDKLDWMSPETKVKAKEKLATFTVKIAYPDKWKDYSALEISDESYAKNSVNVSKWNYDRRINEIGKEVDKTEWFMAPQVVNAYYNPYFNEIVFPAAILQPPFYDYKADDAVNYGGIGAVIGHEVSHGFDDQGAQFDKEGNLNNWWTEADMTAFSERNQKLIDQYNAFEALPGINVNGEFTLGENIGDLGGINVAYEALQIHLAKNGNPGLIENFTPEQRYFINWATIWRIKYRDEELKTRIKTDPHSPGMFRALGPVSNMTEFYAAFDVKEGDAMYRSDSLRVKIW